MINDERTCNGCRYYEVVWTNNTGVWFMSNSKLKHYCDNPKGKKYEGGVSMAMLDFPFGEYYFDYETCIHHKYHNES